MPTPSGLKISELPSGVIPASGSDLLVLVQNGNTVQVPVSGVRRNTTAELPESGNLYYTDARARAALSAGDGITYNSSEGIISLNGALFSEIENAYDKTIKNISVIEEGKKKSLLLTFNDNTTKNVSWTDQGQDISITAQAGLAVNIQNGIWNISNSDRGSNQNIFKTVNVSGSQSLIANSNTDYLTIIPGSNIGITSSSGNRTITISTTGIANPVTGIVAGTGISVSRVSGEVTINNSDRGSSQNIFKTIAVSGLSSINASGNTDTLTFVAGSNINFSTDPTTRKLVINAVSGAGLVGNVTSVNGLSGAVVLTTDNIGEGSNNLYFTTDRARSSISAGNGITISNGVISTTANADANVGFDRIWLSSGVNQQMYGGFNAPYSSPILNLVAGSGITLNAYENTAATNIAYRNYLTISATGKTPAAGSSGEVQYNRNGETTGASGLTYSPDTFLTTAKGLVVNPFSYSTGITIKCATNAPMTSNSLLAFVDSGNNLVSRFTPSGSFVGAVTPDIITTTNSLLLSDAYNGKTILSQLDIPNSGLYLYLGSGITISGWNVKVIQDSSSTVYIQPTGAYFIKKPSDRYSQTRLQNSVVEILKTNSNTFVAYGDLAPIGSTSTVGGTTGGGTTGGGTTGGGTTPGGNGGGNPIDGGGSPTGGTGDPNAGASCADATNRPTITVETIRGSESPKNLADAKKKYPSVGIYPPVVYEDNNVFSSWGSYPTVSFPKFQGIAIVHLPPSSNRSCYELISITDQYGHTTNYPLNSDTTYAVNIYAPSVIGTSGIYKNAALYAEATFTVNTRKIGGTTNAYIYKVAMAKENFYMNNYTCNWWFSPNYGSGPPLSPILSTESWISASYSPVEYISIDNSTITSWYNTLGGDYETVAHRLNWSNTDSTLLQILPDGDLNGSAKYRDPANGIGGNSAIEFTSGSFTGYLRQYEYDISDRTLSGGNTMIFVVVKFNSLTNGTILNVGGNELRMYNSYVYLNNSSPFYVNSISYTSPVTQDEPGTGNSRIYAFQGGGNDITVGEFDGKISEIVVVRWADRAYIDTSPPNPPWGANTQTKMFDVLINNLTSKYNIS